MDSNTNTVNIYVRLLGEGTEVSRPTQALYLGDGLFKVLATEHYDPDDEKWEFPPGSIVRATRIEQGRDAYLLATEPD